MAIITGIISAIGAASAAIGGAVSSFLGGMGTPGAAYVKRVDAPEDHFE